MCVCWPPVWTGVAGIDRKDGSINGLAHRPKAPSKKITVLSQSPQGTNGDDADSARAAEIGGGKEGKAAGPSGSGAGAAGEGDGGLKACCVNYWKGYSTGWTLVGVGLLIMALSALVSARFDKMFLAKLQDKLAVTSMEQVGGCSWVALTITHRHVVVGRKGICPPPSFFVPVDAHTSPETPLPHPQARETPHWFGNEGINTASLAKLYFYNITNAPEFLAGQPPALDLVGASRHTRHRDGHSQERER